MDRTPENIKMCRKAVEMQALRPVMRYNRVTSRYEPPDDAWQDGDWFWCDGDVLVYGGDCYNIRIYDGKLDLGSAGYKEGDGEKVSEIIWLPLQDQLQAMVVDVLHKYEFTFYWALGDHFLTLDLKRWGHESHPPTLYDIKRHSMEQLWLAFVMKEKYNKAWDGNDWVTT